MASLIDRMLADSPIFLWPGQELGTTAQDATANNNDGTHSCAGVTGPGGQLGLALSPNNTDDVIASGVTTNYTAFTVACIFKWPGHSSMDTYVIASKAQYYASGHAEFPFSLVVSPSGLLTANFSIGNDFSTDLSLASGSSVGTTQWHMVHCTYLQGGLSKLYLDGIEIATGTSVTVSTNSHPWSFGRHAAEYDAGVNKSAFYNGALCAMALYNSQLSAAQVKAHYDTWRATPPAVTQEVLADSPYGYWPLEEASGSVAYDVSGNARHGTYSGTGITYRIRPETGGGITTDNASGKMTLPSSVISALGSSQAQSWEWWQYHTIVATSGSAVQNGPACNSHDALVFSFGESTGVLSNEVATIVNSVSDVDDRTGFTGFSIPVGWHHHVFTFSGTQNGWGYYLDGVLTGSTVSFSGGSFGVPTGTTWTIGQVFSGYYAATIERLAIYTSTLSAARVLAHYRSGVRWTNANAAMVM